MNNRCVRIVSVNINYSLLVGILFAVHFDGFTQSKLSYQQACADIDYYFNSINSIHPNMYWHTPKSVVDSFIIATKEKCIDSVDVGVLSYWLAQSNRFFDYHTSIDLKPPLKIQDNVFPFIEFHPSGMFIAGRKIESLNGIKAEKLLHHIKNFIGCDVPLATMCYELNHSFIYPVVFKYYGINSPFEIKFEDDKIIYEVSGTPYEKLNIYNNDFTAYEFEVFPNDTIALIRFNRCVCQDQQKLDTFLFQCFQKIFKLGIKYLFIDVSKNPGGCSDAVELFF